MKLKILSILFSVVIFSACQKEEEDSKITETLSSEKGEELSGGINNTVFDRSVNAFGFASPGLSGEDQLNFFVGNSFFNQSWVSAPASAKARDGLGPTFNAIACSSCHFKDGRGKPPIHFGEKASGLLLRLSLPGMGPNGEPKPHPNYGDQLQDHAILGVKAEGIVQLTYTEIQGEFEDGTKYNLQKPHYQIVDLNYGPLGANIQISPRVAPQMIGMGLIEAIDEADLMQLSDEMDADNDGISGRLNQVWNEKMQMTTVGRFGWKANVPTVAQQAAAAFNGDMGITTPMYSNQNCPTPQVDCGKAPNGGNPEIELNNFNAVALYSSNLAVPARRNVNDEKVLEGKQIFHQLGCASCHHPTFTTGTNGTFAHLKNQKIWPYSDFLLHDMGEGLADGRSDYLANGNEWRTPPLWGIGLIETVNGHTNLLHDGRARNVTEAILWHGGEAAIAKDNFVKLALPKREKLLSFINSL